MTENCFEDLAVWKNAVELDSSVDSLIKENVLLKMQFALRNQMNRSAGSIADNIAEGFERNGNREFIQYLSIAKGSCGELRSQFHRCERRGIIDSSTAKHYIEKCKLVSASIANLIKHLKKSEFRGSKFK
jgi:four helix bundle protein